MATSFDPDTLLCPLCFETPLNDIFQCINGHTICKDCKTSLEECPQCRVPFASGLVRNRALENLLDSMKLNCPFSKQGCKEKVTRNDYKTHTLVCQHNPKSLKLCSILGTLCPFVANSENVRVLIDHFIKDHKFELVPTSKVDLTLNRFLETINQFCIKKFQFGGALVWRPFLLSVVDKEIFFLVISIIRGASITWCYLIFGNTEDAGLYEVECTVKGSATNNHAKTTSAFDFSWKLKPLTLDQVKLIGLQNFPLRVQVDNSFKLRFVSKEDNLLVKISIQKAEADNQPNDGVLGTEDETANLTLQPSEWVFKQNPASADSAPSPERRMTTVEVIKSKFYGKKC